MDNRLEQAAAWHIRLTSDDAREQDWVEFTVWLETDAANRDAYDAVERISADVDANATVLRDRLAAQQDAAPATAQVLTFPQPKRVPLSRRHWLSVGVAALAAAIAGLVLVPGLGPRPADTQRFATQTGEQRDVALADGSHIHLNTATTVEVAMSDGRRDVRLVGGEAYFDVAKDPSRPFVVEVGDQRVAVVGTAFNIIRHDGNITVTVARGVVAVQTGANGERLTAGDQIAHREGERGVVRTSVDPAVAVAWRDGRLVFTDAPVSQVISDLNRYFSPSIRAEDVSVADLRFTGVLKIDDQGAVLKRLEEFLPVVAQQQSDGVILRRKATPK